MTKEQNKNFWVWVKELYIIYSPRGWDFTRDYDIEPQFNYFKDFDHFIEYHKLNGLNCLNIVLNGFDKLNKRPWEFSLLLANTKFKSSLYISLFDKKGSCDWDTENLEPCVMIESSNSSLIQYILNLKPKVINVHIEELFKLVVVCNTLDKCLVLRDLEKIFERGTRLRSVE